MPTMPMTHDYTSLACLARCETEYVLRHVRQLATPVEHPAVVCGRAIHAGVRAYYAGADIAAATREAYGDYTPPPDDHRTLARALAYVEAYARTYPQPWPFDVLHNETYIDGDEFGGIPDRVVRRHLDGGVYPLELKTTSLYPGTAWQAQWGHSLQATLQLDLAEQAYGLSCAGFWLEAIYVSGRRAGPQPDDFVRVGPIPYSAALRAELRATARRAAARATALAAAPDSATKNPDACLRYSHLCPFFRLCSTDPADREDVLAMAVATGELAVRPWEPATRDLTAAPSEVTLE